MSPLAGSSDFKTFWIRWKTRSLFNLSQTVSTQAELAHLFFQWQKHCWCELHLLKSPMGAAAPHGRMMFLPSFPSCCSPFFFNQNYPPCEAGPAAGSTEVCIFLSATSHAKPWCSINHDNGGGFYPISVDFYLKSANKFNTHQSPNAPGFHTCCSFKLFPTDAPCWQTPSWQEALPRCWGILREKH